MLALLLGLDPWLLCTVIFALLWVVEMRASYRRWLNGMVHGYTVAARQVHDGANGAAADATKQRIMDRARADMESR